MTLLAPEGLTQEAGGVDSDAVRDRSYKTTRTGRYVTDFLDYKRLENIAERTLSDYEWALAIAPSSLCRLYPDTDLAEIADSDCARCLNGFPPGSRRERKAAYDGLFRWAKKTRRIPDNPMDYLPSVKRRKQRFIDTFNEAETEALLALDLVDGALMQILLDTGLRKSEARHLRLRDYRDEATLETPHGRIVVLGGKGGKDRVIPATRAVKMRVNELALLEGLNRDDYLWYSRPGGHDRQRSHPIGDSSFQGWWTRCRWDARVRRNAKAREANAHLTRHTFAKRWLERGGRLETLSKAMGHASYALTADLYGHLDNRSVAADMALVEAAVRA